MKLLFIPIILICFSFTACEHPTDVYIFKVPNCQPDRPVVNLKIPLCRIKSKESSVLACNKNYAQYEARYEDFKVTFIMNSQQSERCEAIVVINYPMSSVSSKTKQLYLELIDNSLRTCLDDSSLVLKEEYRVEDETSYNALCDRTTVL
jgi:hypothetical protein